MAETHGVLSPEAVTERYVISSKNSCIPLIGPNVTIQLSCPSDVDNGRLRDSPNVRTKSIMDYKGDSLRYLRGRILTANGPVVGFRSIHESVGESMALLNFQTKERHRFKDFPHRTVDLTFAQHHRFLAVLNGDYSLYIFEVTENCQPKKFLTINNWPAFPPNSKVEPRLSWCPYVYCADLEEETSHMIAVYLGRQIYIVNINVLKESSLPDDMDFEDARKEDGGIYSHFFKDESDDPNFHISSVSISPDSTAVAISKSEGPIQFFTFNDEKNCFKGAHCFNQTAFTRPGLINDLIFLDDLNSTRKGLQFWRTCVVVSNGGRKLALYECQGWRCLGRIRFESTRTVNDFITIPDPSTGFIHLLDVDGMNLYTIEIMNPFRTTELPRFVGITQTSFCSPIYAISPITVNTFETAEESGDDLFSNSNDEEAGEDEETSEGDGGKKHLKTKRYFVAMGKSKMMELQLTLKHQTPAPPSTESSDKETSPAIHVETEQQPLQPDQGLLMQVQSNNAAGIEAINIKLDEVLSRLARMEADKAAENDRLAQKIITGVDFSDEGMRLREGYLINRIEEACETGRLDTIAALRTGILNLSAQVESSVRTGGVESAEYVSQRLGCQVRSALTECLLPSFERSCEVLFERLNEHFRHGINEYLTASTQMIQGTAVATMQLAAQQQHAKAELDRMTLLQMIETNPEAALEAALNKADANILEFVCSKINPESLFENNKTLSQKVMLALVQQFTVSLNRDRDLKFRWIELVIPEIDMTDPEINILVPPVAQKLMMALQEVIDNSPDEQVRRYVRLLYQMTRSSLLQAQTPRNFAATSVLQKMFQQSEHSASQQ